jgi:hypothetical protein
MPRPGIHPVVPGWTIRHASERDVEQVLALWDAAGSAETVTDTREGVLGLLDADPRALLVAQSDDGEIVGSAGQLLPPCRSSRPPARRSRDRVAARGRAPAAGTRRREAHRDSRRQRPRRDELLDGDRIRTPAESRTVRARHRTIRENPRAPRQDRSPPGPPVELAPSQVDDRFGAIANPCVERTICSRRSFRPTMGRCSLARGEASVMSGVGLGRLCLPRLGAIAQPRLHGSSTAPLRALLGRLRHCGRYWVACVIVYSPDMESTSQQADSLAVGL